MKTQIDVAPGAREALGSKLEGIVERMEREGLSGVFGGPEYTQEAKRLGGRELNLPSQVGFRAVREGDTVRVSLTRSSFSREQIRNMSDREYEQNRGAIDAAMRAGLITDESETVEAKFSRSQIGGMSDEEYAANRDRIMDALSKGEIADA